MLAWLLLLILVTKVSSQTNILCNPELSWTRANPNNNGFTFDLSACTATITRGSLSSTYSPEVTVNVRSIFSSSSNYPITFSIQADAFGGEATFGAIFYAISSIDRWNYVWVSQSNPTTITITFNSYSSTSYSYIWNNGNGNNYESATSQFQARYIDKIGFYVIADTLENSSDGVQFTWASVTGLTESPTPNPTDRPTTAIPTDNPSITPSESPTETPSVIPTEVPSNEPTKVPTNLPSDMPSFGPSLSPTIMPTAFPSEIPTNIPSMSPTSKPTDRPSIMDNVKGDLQCNDNNLAVVEILFSYEVGDIYDDEEIDGYLSDITKSFIMEKNGTLSDCYISEYVKKIETDIDIEKIMINITMCTTCKKDEIETGLIKEFVDEIDKDNAIIAIISDTIIIDVDIINERDGEAIIETSTKYPIIDKPDQLNESGDNNDTIWIIIGILLSIICIFIIIMIMLKIRRKDKYSNKIVNGMSIMRVMSSSVVDSKKDVQDGEFTVPKKTGSIQNIDIGEDEKDDNRDGIEMEDMTGSNDLVKDTHSSHNELQIGTPDGNLIMNHINDQVIIGDEEDESPNTGTSGQITSSDDLNHQMNQMNNDDNNNDENNMMEEDTLEIKRWLTEKVRFPQYLDNFMKNGYESLNLIIEIPDKNELKEIGIELAGHRTKIMAEIRKLKDDQHYHDNYLPHNANFAMTFEGD